jgi:hypothetical protein
MRRSFQHRFAAFVLAALPIALLGACSADSPSAPTQTPGPPIGGPTATTFSITVSVSPSTVAAGSTDPVQVRVTVRRTDNNAAPANGTTVVLTTTAGQLGSSQGETSQVLTLIGGQAETSLFPPTTAGTVTLQARLESSVGQGTVTIREADTFFIGSISPSTGSPDGGDTVTINGGGFETPVRVTFNGIPGVVRSVSDTAIRVTTPASATAVPVNTSLLVSVSVTVNLNEANQAVDTLDSAFRYSRGTIQQPVVFSVSPASGPNEGNTRVTIIGEGFEAPVQVFFGTGTSSTNFQGPEASVEDVQPNRIIVRTPSATAFGQNNRDQTVSILVKNLNTGFSAVSSSAFQYGSEVIITAMGPGAGPYTGGTIVTVNGQGFDEPVALSLGGVGQSVLSVNGTQIVFRTAGVAPQCPADGIVEVTGLSVTNIETGANATVPLGFNYIVPRPIITGVSPSAGSQNGGAVVTISGIGFEVPVRVSFRRGGNTFSASITSQNETTIVVRSPAIPNNGLVEVTCDDNGDSTEGDKFQDTAYDVVIENLITGCIDTFEGGFVYRPTDTTCRGDIPPPPAT